MNVITMHGRLGRDAESFQVKSKDGNEGTMVSFILIDYGLPNQKGEPMSIEVHFMKDIALSILPSLVKEKGLCYKGRGSKEQEIHLSFNRRVYWKAFLK